ncbi:hypothetical protein P5673_006826 [Acropora cervicornis]|uniref:Tetratricopeptide repeat protein n=1 Tax=Acropora cervicornis TaxID=6130 RepID=A0AAD9QWQ4_ACRCE|nr:hypothetical protein P5673_006826 [Acropora cervicornis]
MTKLKNILTKHLSFRIQIDDKEGEASSNGNLGTVFLSLGKYDKAKEYLEKALAIKKEMVTKGEKPTCTET